MIVSDKKNYVVFISLAFLIVLLLTALGYAVWFTWYVCKQKRLRTENRQRKPVGLTLYGSHVFHSV